MPPTLSVSFAFLPPPGQEWYEYIESGSSGADIFHKLGNFAWLAVAIGLVESLVCIKFSHG